MFENRFEIATFLAVFFVLLPTLPPGNFRIQLIPELVVTYESDSAEQWSEVQFLFQTELSQL